MAFMFPFFGLLTGITMSKRIVTLAGAGALAFQALENRLHVRNAKTGRNPIIREQQLEKLKKASKALGIDIPEMPDHQQVFELTKEDIYDPSQEWLCRVWFLNDEQAYALDEMMKKDALNSIESKPRREFEDLLEKYEFADEDKTTIRSFLFKGRVDFGPLMDFCDENIKETMTNNFFMRMLRRKGSREEFEENARLLSKAREQYRERQQKQAA